MYYYVYMIQMADVLSVRLDAEIESKLAMLMKTKKIIDKSAYIRQLISRSLTEDLIEYLAGEVKAKRVSAWKAAEVSGIPLRAMLKELSDRGISAYDERALDEDILFAESE
ncbi:MAG: UPF0175 family protein [Candidatus Thorarchaeota archaeon]